MEALEVEALHELIKPRLLLQKVSTGRPGGLRCDSISPGTLGRSVSPRQTDGTREEQTPPHLSGAHSMTRDPVNLGYVAARELQDCRFPVCR